MADKEVSGLTAGTALDGTEIFHGVQGGNSRQFTSLLMLPGKKGTIASGATITIPYGTFFHVTGTTGITDIDFTGDRDGLGAWLEFDDVLPITHNGTTLNLPGQADLTTAAGDRAYVVQDASDNVHVMVYIHAGTPPVPGPHVILEDQKTSGTNAGTFTGATDVTRSLTTKVYDPFGYCTLSSNQFTLPAGTWAVKWSAPMFRAGYAKSWLYNATDTAAVAYSQVAYNDGASTAGGMNNGETVVTISSSKAFEIRHRGTITRATDGLGTATSITGSEVYAQVQITKVR